MNITSQFFITYYTGSEDLDLMAMPASFAGNIGKTSDYNRFIEGIKNLPAKTNKMRIKFYEIL